MAKITPVCWKVLDAVFPKAGFRFHRQKGSHRSNIKDGILRPVVIPTYDEITVFVERSNLKTAELSSISPPRDVSAPKLDPQQREPHAQQGSIHEGS